MNAAEARRILALYRPGVDEALEPSVAAALAMARQDPELAKWLERQQAVDAALSRKFAEIPIPFGLETRILANRPPLRAVGPAWAAWLRNPSRVSALAALVLLLGGGTAVLRGRAGPETWAAYQAHMTEEVVEPYALDLESGDLEAVRRAMADAGFPADYRVPRGLEAYPLEGGFQMHWRGHPVTIVCFGSHAEHKPDVWLLVLKHPGLRGAPTNPAPHFAVTEHCPIAVWAEGDNLYLLATEPDGGVDLRALF